MKQTLKTILLIAVIFVPLAFTALNAEAQKSPCKYVKESTDPFTKKTTKGAQMAIGDPFAMREVLFQQSDNKLYLGLRITFIDMKDIVFKKGDKVSFMLGNDDLIEISSDKDVPMQTFTFLDKPVQQWIVLAEVKEDIYKKMSSSPIIAIKFHINNNDYLINGIKERQTKKILENVTCMLANK